MSDLLYKVESRMVYLTMNRPEVCNALSTEMRERTTSVGASSLYGDADDMAQSIVKDSAIWEKSSTTTRLAHDN